MRLGWPLLDGQFGVETSDEGRTLTVITRNVQEQLLRLRHWLRESSAGDTVDLLSTAGDLVKLLESAGMIHNGIEQRT